MKCPTCRENTPDAWKQLWRILPDNSRSHSLPRGYHGLIGVSFDWMQCANPKCEELIVRGEERTTGLGGEPERKELWLVMPRNATRFVDSLVPEDLRTDYLEAAAILDRSPRMSAVLSRRVLTDVLKRYVGLGGFSLAAQIDKFIENKHHPRRLRENLHYLREVGDFGAHTQIDDQDTVVGVTREEAEWTLDVLDGMFEHFIVEPERDKRMRDSWDEKLDATGRKPIALAPDEDE